jgi:hypothetical protein
LNITRPNFLRLHRRQETLQQRQRRSQVQLRQTGDVLGLGLFHRFGQISPALWTKMGDLVLAGDTPRSSLRPPPHRAGRIRSRLTSRSCAHSGALRDRLITV